MKRLASLLIIGILILSCLTACSTSGDGASNNLYDNDGVLKISVYRATFNIDSPDVEQGKKVQDTINSYIKEKGFDFKVEIHDIALSEYAEKVRLGLDKGDINLLWTGSWENTIGPDYLVDNNRAYDITEVLKESKLFNSMNVGQWEAAKYDGKILFVPVYKDNAEGYDLIFRQDFIEKYNWNIESVSKLSDIETMLNDAKKEGLRYPLLLQKTSLFNKIYIDKFDFFTSDDSGNFVAIDKDNDTVVNTIQTPEYNEFCLLIAKWAEAGYISEDDTNNSVLDTAVLSKDWAISWWADIPNNDEATARYRHEVALKNVTNRWIDSSAVLRSCYCVTANSSEEQVKACVDFLGLLYTDSTLADIYTFGIEGEDFDYITSEDGVRKVRQHSDKYSHSMWESSSATVITPVDIEPDNNTELYRIFNEDAKVSPAAGFHFDKGPVEDQYEACLKVYEEYGLPLEIGGVAVTDVNSVIEDYQIALNSAGFEAVLTEFQKQYDEWKGHK